MAKVALVHDFLAEYGGAERVLEALHEIWPAAPLYTAFYDPKSLGAHAEDFKNWDIRSSPAGRWPFFKQFLSPGRLLAPTLFENFDLWGFDVVISSTNTYFAKAVLTKPNQLHFAYCHTPPRYLYGYPTAREWRKRLVGRLVGESMNHFLRVSDFLTSQRVDYFIANSHNTARRIWKFYRRDSQVIYPPVDVKRFLPLALGRSKRKNQSRSQKGRANDGYFLCVSRLYLAKRIDLAIEACNRLSLELKVAGTGKEEANLRKLAGPTIQFLGDVADDQLAWLYRNANATIFPAEEEDFGIVPVESQAAGTPVLALGQGGNLETIIEGLTGDFFDPTIDSLSNLLKHYDIDKYSQRVCIKNAQRFDKEIFKRKIKALVEEKLASVEQF